MFDHAKNDNPDFINMMSDEKLIFLLSNVNVTIICVKTLCNMLTV